MPGRILTLLVPSYFRSLELTDVPLKSPQGLWIGQTTGTTVASRCQRRVPHWTQCYRWSRRCHHRTRRGRVARHGSHCAAFLRLTFFCTSEHFLSVNCLFCFFLGTGDGEWYWEELGDRVLHADASVLGAESMRAASIWIAVSLMSLSFLVQGLKF